MVTDFSQEVKMEGLETLVTMMEMTSDSCCAVLDKMSSCRCSSYSSPVQPFVSQAKVKDTSDFRIWTSFYPDNTLG